MWFLGWWENFITDKGGNGVEMGEYYNIFSLLCLYDSCIRVKVLHLSFVYLYGWDSIKTEKWCRKCHFRLTRRCFYPKIFLFALRHLRVAHRPDIANADERKNITRLDSPAARCEPKDFILWPNNGFSEKSRYQWLISRRSTFLMSLLYALILASLLSSRFYDRPVPCSTK